MFERRARRVKGIPMKRLLMSALLALALMPAAVQAAPPAPPVPGDIAVTDGSKPFLTTHASGLQIYACNGTWTLLRPDALLTDKSGKVIGTHYAGPSWELRDGSIAKARRDAGIRVDQNAIDWLRLAVTAVSAGADGDRLTNAKWIQRINTVGGLAPAGPCAPGATIGVPYTADYVFWK